jgi:ADP-ribose pyrophosphatase
LSRAVRLAGPLATPKMLAALGLTAEGRPETVQGTLIGGQRAGIDVEDWPVLQSDGGAVPVLRAVPTRELRFYADVMGLPAVDHRDGQIRGVRSGQNEAAPWSDQDWPDDLAAAIAREIVSLQDLLPAPQIAARLPMIAVWAESRLRAAEGPRSGGSLVPPRMADDLRLIERRQPYAGFFAVDVWDLSHRTHAGGFTPAITREGFVMGDAVVVLPWDPVRDRLLVIEQFRVGPALRHDPQPWLLEPIAGRIDAGESVEDAARREALEEADLRLGRLFPAVHHYPSPGAVTEFLYLYVGIADLPDGSAGVNGLDAEVEDIRGHLVARADLSAMVRDGQITNGPLAMLSLWLDRQYRDLLKELSTS